MYSVRSPAKEGEELKAGRSRGPVLRLPGPVVFPGGLVERICLATQRTLVRSLVREQDVPAAAEQLLVRHSWRVWALQQKAPHSATSIPQAAN